MKQKLMVVTSYIIIILAIIVKTTVQNMTSLVVVQI